MKIKITGQGLKKAQFLNSQIDTPRDWKAPQSSPNQNPWLSNSFDWTRKPEGELFNEPKSPDLSNIPRVNQTIDPRRANVSLDNPIMGFQESSNQANPEPFQPKTFVRSTGLLPAQNTMDVNGNVTTSGSVGNPSMSYNTVQNEDNLDKTQSVKPKPKQKNPGLMGMGISMGLDLASSIGNAIRQPQIQKEWDKKFRDSNLTDNAYPVTPGNASGNRGDYDINSGMFRPNETGFKSKGMYTNTFATAQPMAQDGLSVEPGMIMPSFNQSNPLSMMSVNYTPIFNGTGPTAPGPTNYGPKPLNITDVKTNISALDHNNPGNIHISPFAQKYGAVAGRKDIGGRVAVFPDMATGFKAMEDLIFGPTYNNLTVTQSRQRWVGHDGWQDSAKDMVHAVGGDIKLKDLTPDQKDIFLGKVTKWENVPQYYQELKKIGLLRHAEGGSVNKENMKIRITAGPDSIDHMAYGGQKGYGFDLGQRNTYSKMNQSSFSDASNTIQEVPRDEANIEAERGETVYGDLDGDGILEQKTIGGERHVNGGTPLNVPEGSFIFSDTKKMKIKDPEILKQFGKTSFAKGGVTPADIAKQYNITKYKAILQDPLSDPIAKKTAEMMITNMNAKLAKLADVQESMKGFPQGRPKVALEHEQREQGLEQAAYGGYLKHYQGDVGPSTVSSIPYPLQTATQNSRSTGTDYGNINGIMKGAELHDKYPWYKPFTTANTSAGHTTPTGANSLYTGDTESQYESIPYWEKRHGSPFKSMSDLQGYVYDELDKNNPSSVSDMWKRFGKTYHGPTNRQGFVDNMGGARTANLFGERIWDKEKEKEIPQKHDMTYDIVDNGGKGTIPYVPGFTPTSSKSIPGRGGWWLQDKINLTNATANLAGIKKYLPYIPDASLQSANPTFQDSRGQAGALESGYQNDARMSGIYGPSSALSSNLSSMAGKQAEQLAGVIGGVGAQNVAIGNQFAEKMADLTNSGTAQNMMNRVKRWEGNVIANQQYDNAQKEGRTNFVNALNQGFTNAANTYNENSINPHFGIDTRSGGKMFFKGNSGNIFNQSYGTQGGNDNYLDQYHNEYQKALKMFNDSPNDRGQRDQLINQHLNNWSKMNTESKRATTNAWGMPKSYTETTRGWTGGNGQ
jgi:hypothetical protein